MHACADKGAKRNEKKNTSLLQLLHVSGNGGITARTGPMENKYSYVPRTAFHAVSRVYNLHGGTDNNHTQKKNTTFACYKAQLGHRGVRTDNSKFAGETHSRRLQGVTVLSTCLAEDTHFSLSYTSQKNENDDALEQKHCRYDHGSTGGCSQHIHNKLGTYFSLAGSDNIPDGPKSGASGELLCAWNHRE